MTSYETMTLVISIIAIIASIGIPLTGYLHKRLQRPKLDIYEFEYQPLTIVDIPPNNHIMFNFSILCQNAQCVVRSVEACVTSERTDEQAEMRWATLQPMHLNWANGMGSIVNLNTMTKVHPLLLEAGSLTPLSVFFGSFPGDGPSARYRLANSILWREGRYKLTVKLLYDADSVFEKTYRFDLSAEEASQLQHNTAGASTGAANPSDTHAGGLHYSFVAKNVSKNG